MVAATSRAAVRLTPLAARCTLVDGARIYADLPCIFDPVHVEVDVNGVPISEASPVAYVSYADLDAGEILSGSTTFSIGDVPYRIEQATLQTDGLWLLDLYE